MTGSSLWSAATGAQTPERIARYIYQMHDQLVPPTMPARPAQLRASDDDLIEWDKLSRVGGTLDADQRTQLRLLSQWRLAVWKAEDESGSRLGLLVSAALDIGVQQDADTLCGAVLRGWNVRPADVPEGLGWFDLRQWCFSRAIRYDVLPWELRTMSKRRPKPAAPGMEGKKFAAHDVQEPQDDSQEMLTW